ncbi:hypothetical protein HYPSUDRAFT_1054104, partial [Hypholoma sublateritium FD-334 SS-4]
TSRSQARYLKDAASTTLDLLAAAKDDEDENLECLSNDAAEFTAAIWRSYLGSSSRHLWPSRELRDIIIGIIATLHSARQYIDGGIQMRKSKIWLVRRVKVAWDAPKIKAYRKQLGKGVLMAQIEILKLSLDDMQKVAADSVGSSPSREIPVINPIMEHGSGILRDASGSYPRDGQSTRPGPSMRPTNEQFHRESDIGSTDRTRASDNGAPAAAPEERLRSTLSRPWPAINMMFVSGSAVSIGGGDAHVYTRT